MKHVDGDRHRSLSLETAPAVNFPLVRRWSNCILHGVAAAITDPAAADARRRAFVQSPEFRRWFAGSRVTHDGTESGMPIMVFRGCRVGEDRLTPHAAGQRGAQRLFWLTSSRLNASFFEDGELQNAYVRLCRPLVLSAAGMGQRHPPLSRIAEDARRRVRMGLATWDGVIFNDVVDGSHPSTVYVVFPRHGHVGHAVMVIGRTRYDADGLPVFTGLQPCRAPVSFGRSDVPGLAPPRRRALHPLSPPDMGERPASVVRRKRRTVRAGRRRPAPRSGAWSGSPSTPANSVPDQAPD